MKPPCEYEELRARRHRHGKGNLLGRFVRARMHRRIFLWFGATILVTGLIVMSVMSIVGASNGWKRDVERFRTFVAGRFERVWDSPAERDELARAVSRDLETDLTLVDDKGQAIATYGDACTRGMSAPIVRDGKQIGSAMACLRRSHSVWPLALAALIACVMLWLGSGKIARRLSKPLDELVRVATDIGAGRYASRVRLGRRDYGEVSALACVINDMAARIEQQMADQRELLAAVSHEIRTPLARIRLLVEIARDRADGRGKTDGRAAGAAGIDASTLDELDREVMEIDALVSELLASSRLQFAALTPSRLDAGDVARRALDRAAIPSEALVVEGTDLTLHADATLLARALANLIDNARKHGGGIKTLRVRTKGERVRFEAEDDGPGFAPGDEVRVFDPFVQRPSAFDSSRDGSIAPGPEDRGALGLGLSLVKRIAEAHGGAVDASNRAQGGARVAIEFPRGAPAASTPRVREPAPVSVDA